MRHSRLVAVARADRRARALAGSMLAVLLLAAALCAPRPAAAGQLPRVEEATIATLQQGILERRYTATDVVHAYLARIKAYNGACVRQPQGILGPAQTIAQVGQVNALITLNLRPAARQRWGFDARKARSQTDARDDDPALPDALEAAAALDRAFAASGKLVGPLHGIPVSIKDQFDTADLRTTSGADAAYANDRPPADASFVKKLREAGAIILAKANMGEYASGDRSAFGGVSCNPYDTERSPGRSSGGSGASVAANLVMCSIGEESGPSVRNPAKNNNIVGLAPTQELVSRAGIVPASFLNDRVGPMCRTVGDVARVLDVIAGYDPKDELTAFSVGRRPAQPYAASSAPQRLGGLRIGVLREYMDKSLFTVADAQSIDIVERGIGELKKLGATVVDPGPGGALFQSCAARYTPSAFNSAFIRQYPQRFPFGEDGRPAGDHLPLLVAMAADPTLFPHDANAPTMRGIGGERAPGEARYVLDRYLQQRGDANIKSTADLIARSKFYSDVREGSGYSDKKKTLQGKNADRTLDLAGRMQLRFALQQIALQCMASLELDAVTYPTGNVPAPRLGAPTEPTVNGRSALAWTLLGANGFPAISVPAGFTTEVYDRVADARAEGGTRLVGPLAASLPVNIDFLARPFDEPTLLRIAGAYEAATHARRAPAGFGPLRE
ncbi:amidase [Solimonas flava]|uniref:amidase n=1 Tax=Solimonas flava TaxID=415849 RepID=UPI00040BC626|nr:amidase [Solimonas flava]